MSQSKCRHYLIVPLIFCSTVYPEHGMGHAEGDSAVLSHESHHVSILLGNGNGAFRDAMDYETGDRPWCVAAGDFDEEGYLDLVVANFFGQELVMLHGNGDGSFQKPSTINDDGWIRHFPTSVAMGDFNEDGHLDLVASEFFFRIHVLLGNGDGTFQDTVDYGNHDLKCVWSVVVMDINEDGHQDLAVSGYGGVWHLSGNGDGTFQAAVGVDPGSGPRPVAIGDFDEDGREDLAVPKYGDVSIFLGNMDPSIWKDPSYDAIDSPTSVAVGDFNEDGHQDLAVTNLHDTNVSVPRICNGNPEPFIDAVSILDLCGNTHRHHLLRIKAILETMGISYDLITPACLTPSYLAGTTLVLIPSHWGVGDHVWITPESCAALKNFVRSGGAVVALDPGAGFGPFSPDFLPYGFMVDGGWSHAGGVKVVNDSTFITEGLSATDFNHHIGSRIVSEDGAGWNPIIEVGGQDAIVYCEYGFGFYVFSGYRLSDPSRAGWCKNIIRHALDHPPRGQPVSTE